MSVIADHTCECCWKLGVDPDGRCTNPACAGHAANADMGPECPGNPYHLTDDEDD